ncbi:MAG: LysE family transporter [Myxococcales bacterium]|nr:LysE family transporter [Myxococcales bacterium]
MIVAAIFGFLFGFIGSMPLAGPIAAIVFSRAIDKRGRGALFVAYGGAIAEAVYAFFAFFGVSALMRAHPSIMPMSQGVAGAVLVILGVLFLRRDAEKESPIEARPDSAWRSALLGFFVTALNPSLIATWTAASATLAGTGWVDFSPHLALPFALGACVGISAWAGILVTWILKFRERFSKRTLNRVIQVMGVLLIAGSGWFFWQFARYLFG